MKLTYLGHAAFILEQEGRSIVFDPYEEGSVPGLHFPDVQADLILTSHPHADHNAVHQVRIKKDADASIFTIRTIETDHDANGGKDRGKNTVHIVEVSDERIVHLGDLGRPLRKEEIEQLKHCSVLLIPCGGTYTIDPFQARTIVEQVQPRTTVLMHYRREGVGYEELEDLEQIKAVFKGLKQAGTSVESPFATGVMVMDPLQKK